MNGFDSTVQTLSGVKTLTDGNGCDISNGVVNCKQLFVNGVGISSNGTETVITVKGDKGDQGNPGQDAQQCTVQVGTTTLLQPGSTPTVTNSGTNINSIFNFGIPIGQQGIQGIIGPTGASLIGPTGSQGIIGPTGASLIGPTGSQGIIGPTGASLIGPTGSQGIQGTSQNFNVEPITILNPIDEGYVNDIQTYSSASGINHKLYFGIPRGESVYPNTTHTATALPFFQAPTVSIESVDDINGDKKLTFNFGIPRGEYGKDGSDGKDGKDGSDGKDGKDGSDATFDIVGIGLQIADAIFTNAQFTALGTRIALLEAWRLIVTPIITELQTNVTTLIEKTTEMSYFPAFGTYFETLNIWDGTDIKTKLLSNGLSEFTNTMRFKENNNTNITLSTNGNITSNGLVTSASFACDGVNIHTVNDVHQMDTTNTFILKTGAEENIILNPNGSSRFRGDMTFYDTDNDESILINNNGDVFFKGHMTIGDGVALTNENHVERISLNADGSSSFDGNMTIGHVWTNSKLNVYTDISVIEAKLVLKEIIGTNQGQDTYKENIILNNDGTSSFHGNMTIGTEANNNNLNVNGKTTLSALGDNNDILIVKNSFGMSVLQIANNQDLKVNSGMEVGIMGSDQNLIINCTTQINKNTVIGTQANNKSLTINGDLTVYGNIRCTGNLRCTGTGHFDNFICDNDTRLHQTPDRDIEVGSFFNQITSEFDNFIADINI